MGISRRDIVVRLLALQQRADQDWDKYDKAGLDLGPHSIIGNFHLLDLAMDILGYPPDTSDQTKEGEVINEETNRDWSRDEWEEQVLKGGKSIPEFSDYLERILIRDTRERN